MAAASDNEGYLELYDLTAKQAVAKAPLAEIKFIPRAGERIFLPVVGPKHWDSFTVVTVEYFLGHETTSEPSPSSERGMGRVTVYVEHSK